MSDTTQHRRFRVNPMEVLILAVVSAVFGHSLYQLAYHPDGMQAGNPVAALQSHTREPASVVAQPSVESTLNVDCSPSANYTVDGEKLRVQGAFCQKGSSVNVSLKNETTQYQATVFSEPNDAHFASEYVPLSPGSNHLVIEHRSGNHIFKQSLTVERKPASKTQ